MAEKKSGWARLFQKAELEGEDFLTKVLESIARIVEGGNETETFREIRAQMKEVFACDDCSLFFVDGHRPKADEGAWVLKVKAGFGKGNKVCQNDARAVPSLVPGKRLVSSEFLAERAVLKAIALAFEEDCFYGADIENKKVVLLKNPTPEDDLGSGDLSLLAIPLRHHNRLGRVVEKTRVGVLALYKTPTQRDLGELERPFRALLANAIVNLRCTLKDPVTGLFTEGFLREELGRQQNLHALTGGKLQGGVVVGWIDTLDLYKQTLETQANVDPNVVSECVSEVLAGVADCVWARCREHSLGAGVDFGCGYPGRIGQEGFGAILPRLSAFEMGMWGAKLQKEVVARPFTGEDHLPSGDVSVSLRVIPFGAPGTSEPDDTWKVCLAALDEVKEAQHKARADAKALKAATATLLVRKGTAWVSPSEYAREAKEEVMAPRPAAPSPAEVARNADLDLVDEVPDAASIARATKKRAMVDAQALAAVEARSAGPTPVKKKAPPRKR